MAVLAGFAFVSGIITIFSPCILPMLPVVLAGSSSGGKSRPAGIIAGFVFSFSLVTLGLAALVRASSLDANALRWAAVAVIALFGLVLLLPGLNKRFQLLASRISSRFANGRPFRPVNDGPKNGRERDGAKSARVAAAGETGSEQWSWLRDFLPGVPIGMSLGLLWTPCVGPILASVITLAISQSVDAGALVITVAYSLGTAVPMAAIMFGGRKLIASVPWLSGRLHAIQRGFGVVMLILAVGLSLGWDRSIQQSLLAAFPGYGSGLTAIEESAAVSRALEQRSAQLDPTTSEYRSEDGYFTGTSGDTQKAGMAGHYGKAPELVAQGPWINSPALTMDELAGQVVLIDFWTYSCINCIRTLPYLSQWQEKYAEQGLTIIGVHSPEFAFEHDVDNVRQAVRELGIEWPVVLDNNFAQWSSYANRFWPAHYLIDAQGEVRYFHYGEGDYRQTEQMIQSLLIEAGHAPSSLLGIEQLQDYGGTGETYLGYRRAERYAGSPELSLGAKDYNGPQELPVHQWALGGRWDVRPEYAAAVGTESKVELRFEAKTLYAVLAPAESETTQENQRGSAEGAEPGTDAPRTAGSLARVSIDGGDEQTFVLDASKMYTLAEFERQGEHLLRLRLPPGARIYTFTFGG